jgi:hypothetical protein
MGAGCVVLTARHHEGFGLSANSHPNAWLAESTELMLEAMRDAGPDRGCWTWWGRTQAPQTSGAVAPAQPLPTDVAVEGIDEFLTTVSATTVPWPFKPATIDLRTIEGRACRLTLNADGVRCDNLDVGAEPGDMTLRGAASDLVLYYYQRLPLDGLETTGNTEPMEHLADWDPNA